MAPFSGRSFRRSDGQAGLKEAEGRELAEAHLCNYLQVIGNVERGQASVKDGADHRGRCGICRQTRSGGDGDTVRVMLTAQVWWLQPGLPSLCLHAVAADT